MTTTTPTSATHAADLLARVDSLRPLIEAHIADNERDCRLADPVYDALIDAGFYSMMTPSAFGGLEMHPCDVYPVIEALAAVDGATGWNVNQSLSVTTLMSTFPGPAASMFGADPSTPLCSSPVPPMFAHRVDGGVRVSGRIGFLSGVARARHGLAAAVILDGDEPVIDAETGMPESILIIFDIDGEGVEIVDVWNPIGMRGTGSNDAVFADYFVADERTAPFGISSERPSEWAAPMYGFVPFFGITVHAVVPLGIARAALEEVTGIVAEKTPNFFETPLRERTTAQDGLGRCRALLDAAMASIDVATRRAIDEIAVTGQPMSNDARIAVALAGAHGGTAARDVARLLRNLAGTSAIKSGGSLERRLRDIETITQHLVLQEGRYASAGLMMLGEPSDLALLHL